MPALDHYLSVSGGAVDALLDRLNPACDVAISPDTRVATPPRSPV